MKGYWRHPGCRLNFIFSIKSAGDVAFLVKSIVLCTDELNQVMSFRPRNHSSTGRISLF